MDWADDKVTQLTSLWKDGIPTAEIGRRLGCSPSAVIGKAHRCELSGRRPPIIRKKVRELPAQLHPPNPMLAQQKLPAPSPAETTGPTAVAAEQVPPPPKVSVATAHRATSSPNPQSGGVRLSAGELAPRCDRIPGCLWPIGEPGEPGSHFCDGCSVPRKPYCEEYAARAYVKVRDRREAAA